MRTLLIFFCLFFPFFLNANESIIYCESNKIYDLRFKEDVKIENIKTFFIIKINKISNELFFLDVKEDGKESESLSLFTNQKWNVIENTDVIRAYANAVGEILYDLNSKRLSLTFHIGKGTVGVILMNCINS